MKPRTIQTLVWASELSTRQSIHPDSHCSSPSLSTPPLLTRHRHLFRFPAASTKATSCDQYFEEHPTEVAQDEDEQGDAEQSVGDGQTTAQRRHGSDVAVT